MPHSLSSEGDPASPASDQADGGLVYLRSLLTPAAILLAVQVALAVVIAGAIHLVPLLSDGGGARVDDHPSSAAAARE